MDAVSTFTEDRDAWRRSYLSFVMPFLQSRRHFQGGELCAYCRDGGLAEPWHHNEWVTMPQVLQRMGLITPLGKCAPTTPHSHIDELTVWNSNVADGQKLAQLELFA